MPHISPFQPVGQSTDILDALGCLDEDRPEAYHAVAAEEPPRYDGRSLPVVGVAVYRCDVVVLRKGDRKSGHKSTRGVITMLSDDSLKRLAFVANNANVDFRSMITLTYPNEFPVSGKVCKQHLDAMLKALKRKCGDGLQYLWFLEFQKRGAPHFHLLLEIGLMREDADNWRAWLSNRWYKIVKSGDDLHLLAGTRWENVRQAEGLKHYVTKYAAKTYQKQVPDGFTDVGRFWGYSRSLEVMPVLLAAADEEAVKAALHDWPYASAMEVAIPRVLFNASQWWGVAG